MSDKEVKSKVGEPIWVESLLNDSDYAECAKRYPNTYVKGSKKVQFFKSDYEWRWRMGGNVTAEEIKKNNKWYDMLLKEAKLVSNE